VIIVRDDSGMQIASRSRVVVGLLMLVALTVLGVVAVLAVTPSAPRAAVCRRRGASAAMS